MENIGKIIDVDVIRRKPLLSAVIEKNPQVEVDVKRGAYSIRGRLALTKALNKLHVTKTEKGWEKFSFEKWTGEETPALNNEDVAEMAIADQRSEIVKLLIRSRIELPVHDQDTWDDLFYLFSDEDLEQIVTGFSRAIRKKAVKGYYPSSVRDELDQEFSQDSEWLRSWVQFIEEKNLLPDLKDISQTIDEVSVDQYEYIGESAGVVKSRPFVEKIRGNVIDRCKIGFRSFVENFNFKDKDKRSYIPGIGVGIILAAMIPEAPIPWAGWVKSGLTLAAFTGVMTATNWSYARELRSIEQKYAHSSDEKLKILQSLQEDRQKGRKFIADFFAGVCVGGFSKSLASTVVELSNIPLPTFADIDQKIAEALAGTGQIGPQVELNSVEPNLNGVNDQPTPTFENQIIVDKSTYFTEDIAVPVTEQTKEWIRTINSLDGQFGQAIQHTVWESLPTIDEVLIASENTPAAVGENTYDALKIHLQHVLEDRANGIYQANLGDLVRDNVSLEEVVTSGQREYSDWLKNSSSNLLQVEAATFLDGLDRLHSILEDPSVVRTEVSLGSDWSFPSISERSADNLGVHIASNYDILVTHWHKLFPGESFPANLGDINYLITQAENRNIFARVRLEAALKFIPEGLKFKVLTQHGVSTVTELLRAIS